LKKSEEIGQKLITNPNKIELQIKNLPFFLVKVLENVYNTWRYQNRVYSFFCKEARNKLDTIEPDSPALLVYCKAGSKLCIAAKEECERAVWGLTNDYYRISAVYEPNNKYILWHEALHLFGAEDCYELDNPNAGTTCKLEQCIMQYEPREGSVNEWPFICEKNTRKIKAYFKEHKKAKKDIK